MQRPVKLKDIPESNLYKPRYYRYRRTEQIRAFLASGDEAWEFYGEEIPAISTYNSLMSTIRRNPYMQRHAQALIRAGRVFLVRV